MFDIVLRLVFKLMLLLLIILLVGIVLTLLEELVSALLLIVLLLDAMASDRVTLMVVTCSSSGVLRKSPTVLIQCQMVKYQTNFCPQLTFMATNADTDRMFCSK